jgi:hypothetical protein
MALSVQRVTRVWNSSSQKQRLVALLALIGVIAFAAALAFRSGGNEDEEIIGLVQDLVRSSAFDPEAMRFRNMKVVRTPYSRTKVCGEVNGKNRMGGYTGYVRFVYNGPEADTVTMLEPGATSAGC